MGKNVAKFVYYFEAGTKFKDVGPRLVDSGGELADSGGEPANSGVELASRGVELVDSGVYLELADSGVQLANSGVSYGPCRRLSAARLARLLFAYAMVAKKTFVVIGKRMIHMAKHNRIMIAPTLANGRGGPSLRWGRDPR